jgi:4-hydroxybenzoate polyprenyltransferase
MLIKIQAFADIGRTQGITTTASIAIVGALTSTASISWYHILFFTLIAIAAHMALNTYIAIGDINLDAKTYVPSRNPVSIGILSKKEAMNFVYGGTTCAILLIGLLPLNIDLTSTMLAVLCFIPAFASLVWYGWKGKRVLVSYDFAFSISYTFLVLFGVFAVGGMPTAYTWIFIGVVIFAATAFAQWENGLKDADADRYAGVRSFAVVTNVRNNIRLTKSHPYFLYGCALKIGFLACCFLAFLISMNYLFLAFLLLYGIPSQAYIMYRFLKKERPVDHRRTILLDVTFAAILGYATIVGKTGVWPIILLIVYLISGYLIGSQIQSNCEFKFGRSFSHPPT